MKNIVIAIVAVVFVSAGAAAVLITSGSYNVAADEPHSRALHQLLEFAREQSVAARARTVAVPDLSNADLQRRGAGNYAAMCAGCHLSPGQVDTEIRRGLYPQPPLLPDRAVGDPARDFWIIKHGLKASGMPAWGRSMDDEAIWGIVAFLRWLPRRSPEDYQAAVAASSGHSHGGIGTELPDHDHDHEHEHDSHDHPPAGP